MNLRQNFTYAGPLYEQVYHILRSRINSGEWNSLGVLPGEAELARELKVSVGTMRKAMDQLAREGLVVRERGRGTFARDGGDLWPNGLELYGRDGEKIEPVFDLVDAGATDATAAQMAALRLKGRPGEPQRVFRIDRRWTWGDRLVCRETIVVDARRFPGLLQAISPSAASFHASYAELYRTKVERLIWSFSRSSDEPTLQTSKMAVTRLALDNRSMPIELTELHVLLDACNMQIGMSKG